MAMCTSHSLTSTAQSLQRKIGCPPTHLLKNVVMEYHSALHSSLQGMLQEHKSRVLYSSRKLCWEDQQDLELEVGDMMYTCGMDLQDCISADLSPEAKQAHLFSRVFIRQSMCCTTWIEASYFSSECFDDICSYCSSSDDLLPASETSGMYPLCSTCKSDPTKLGILLKCKRKLVTVSNK